MPLSKTCICCGIVYYKRETQSLRNWEERSKFCSRHCVGIFYQNGRKTRFTKGEKRGRKFPKGNIPWNKIYNEQERKQRLSAAKMLCIANYKANPANKIKIKARSAVNSAIRRGTLARQNCEKCSKRGEAHHYLGYNPKNWFKIKWFCRRHHRQIHKR